MRIRLLAVVSFAFVAVFSVLGIRGYNLAQSAQVADAHLELYGGDTYACPDMRWVLSYLNSGPGEDMAYCSPVRWEDLEHVELVGQFVTPYADIFDDFSTGVLPLDTFVEVFSGKYEGVVLFAIQIFDEHVLHERVGLRPGVVYTVWPDLGA